MSESIPQKTPPDDSDESRLKIYFLPNLLTAGNLFCGFVALTKIVEADPATDNYVSQIYLALIFILLACVCDLFDGRVARWGGAESPFGREFDSLADLISFGVAPAFLVHRIDLSDLRRLSPGAIQCALHAAGRQRQGVCRLSNSIGGGVGGVADAVHDVGGGKRICGRLAALRAAGAVGLFVMDDG